MTVSLTVQTIIVSGMAGSLRRLRMLVEEEVVEP